MEKIYEKIVSVFSNQFNLNYLQENCDELVAECEITNLIQSEYVCPRLNERDDFALSINDGELYFNSKQDLWDDFAIDVKKITTHIQRIKIIINKNHTKDTISIYDIEAFTEYLESLSLSQFLSVISNRLKNNILFFEIQNDDFISWRTDTIAFVTKNNVNFQLKSDIDRNAYIERAKYLSYWEMTSFCLLPEDLYCAQNGTKLQKLFRKANLIYTLCFVCDYSKLNKDRYEYKLNGYKTLIGNITADILKNVDVDTSSCEILYKIYQWMYRGGNNQDKASIVRNILSLNFDDKNLSINKSVFESILSNYKIYEKENVQQYIQVRNELSSLLIDLQEKVSCIVNSFIGDFKTVLITLISFFVSVIVIQVVSTGSFLSGFTNEIIYLSFAFILISFGVLIYSHWELSKKISLYQKHYKQIKERYKDILSEVELETIFEECDPQKDETNNSFVEKQKKYYTILWVFSNLLLIFFLFVLLVINNSQFFKVIKIIICFIQNMYQLEIVSFI
ncbi:MAG: hypothetical protein Q4F69_12095 [Bacteroidia bacterium]|nr:hypothetical protein [Bacteroidia bacterium]